MSLFLNVAVELYCLCMQASGGLDAQLGEIDSVVDSERPGIVPCMPARDAQQATGRKTAPMQPPLLLCGPATACKAALGDMLIQVGAAR